MDNSILRRECGGHRFRLGQSGPALFVAVGACFALLIFLMGCGKEGTMYKDVDAFYHAQRYNPRMTSFVNHLVSKRGDAFIIVYKTDTSQLTFENEDSVRQTVAYINYAQDGPGLLRLFGNRTYDVSRFRQRYGYFDSTLERRILDTAYALIDAYVELNVESVNGLDDNVVVLRRTDVGTVVYVPDLAKVSPLRYKKLEDDYEKLDPQWFYKE